MPPPFEHILYEKREHVAYVTLNRPQVMNALHPPLYAELNQAWVEVIDDDQVWAAVLTGAGDRAFSAGSDLKWRVEDADENELRNPTHATSDVLDNCHKPIIAAINGVALGGGAEIALACDIRLAVPHAQFAHTKINWGMIPAAGAHQRLRNVVGLGMAKEIMFTGRKLEAEEAGRLGIYNHIYVPDQLMSEAAKLANTIAGHSPLAVQQSKKVYDTGAYSEEAFEFEYQASIECYTNGDAMTGAKGFKK